MKCAQHRPVWLASLVAVVLSVGFAACGGLDGRKVTRGPDTPIGGESAGGQPISVGGSESPAEGGGGGTPGDDTPFGGDTFVGGAPPIIDGPPEVLEVDPADTSTGVEPTGNVSLLFSEGLDAASVTAGNVQVKDGDASVEGALSYAGVVAKFDPTRRLSLLGTYDVSVSQNVTDAAGQPLKAAFASSFTVRDGIWSDQKSVFDDVDNFGGDQKVATDAHGNLLFVWSRIDPVSGRLTLLARSYSVVSGWRNEVTLEGTATDAYYPQLAVSPDGDAIVAWLIYDSVLAKYTVRARRLVRGEWEGAKSVASVTSISSTLVTAIGGGRVVVGWIRSASDTYYNYTYLELSSSAVDEDWPSVPTAFAVYDYKSAMPRTYDSIYDVAATIDAKGLVLVGFRHYSYDSTVNSQGGVYYVRKPVTDDWQQPVKIPSSRGVDTGPVLVSDGEGAMAVWTTYAAGDYSLLASRYTKTKQFVAPVPINDPDLKGYVYFAREDDHALVSNGQSFFVTWIQQVGASTNTYANRFDVATGKWDPLATLVSDGEAVSNGNSSIGVDAHGNALVAFDQRSTTGSLVMGARFTASAGAWGAAAPLTALEDDYGIPHLAVAANGTAGLLFGPAGRYSPVGASAGGQFRVFR